MDSTNGHNEPEQIMIPAESAIVSAITAANDPEKATETLKLWRRSVEDAVRADALNGCPSLAPVPMEQASIAHAITAARWIRLVRAAPSWDAGVAILACELQRAMATYALLDNAARQGVLEATFRPEPEHVDESLTLLARAVISTLADTAPDDQLDAVRRLLRAARNVEARPKDSFGNYL